MSKLFDLISTQAAIMSVGGNKLNSIAVAMTYTDRRAIIRTTWKLNVSDRKNKGAIQAISMGRTEDMIALLAPCTEAEILDAAWRLGAWDVLRTEHPPIPAHENKNAPGWGLTNSFRGCPYSINGDPLSQGECPADLINIAAAEGWIDCNFKHTAWSSRILHNGDSTLNHDGSRNQKDMPLMPAPLAERAHQHIYTLGRTLKK